MKPFRLKHFLFLPLLFISSYQFPSINQKKEAFMPLDPVFESTEAETNQNSATTTNKITNTTPVTSKTFDGIPPISSQLANLTSDIPSSAAIEAAESLTAVSENATLPPGINIPHEGATSKPEEYPSFPFEDSSGDSQGTSPSGLKRQESPLRGHEDVISELKQPAFEEKSNSNDEKSSIMGLNDENETMMAPATDEGSREEEEEEIEMDDEEVVDHIMAMLGQHFPLINETEYDDDDYQEEEGLPNSAPNLENKGYLGNQPMTGQTYPQTPGMPMAMQPAIMPYPVMPATLPRYAPYPYAPYPAGYAQPQPQPLPQPRARMSSIRNRNPYQDPLVRELLKHQAPLGIEDHNDYRSRAAAASNLQPGLTYREIIYPKKEKKKVIKKKVTTTTHPPPTTTTISPTTTSSDTEETNDGNDTTTEILTSDVTTPDSGESTISTEIRLVKEPTFRRPRILFHANIKSIPEEKKAKIKWLKEPPFGYCGDTILINDACEKKSEPERRWSFSVEHGKCVLYEDPCPEGKENSFTELNSCLVSCWRPDPVKSNIKLLD